MDAPRNRSSRNPVAQRVESSVSAPPGRSPIQKIISLAGVDDEWNSPSLRHAELPVRPARQRLRFPTRRGLLATGPRKTRLEARVANTGLEIAYNSASALGVFCPSR